MREVGCVVREVHGEVVLLPGEPHALVEAAHGGGRAVRVCADAPGLWRDRRAGGNSRILVGVENQVRHRRDVP